MIFDKLENIDRYHFDLEFVTNYLLSNTYPTGKFEIDGEQKFGINLEYQTKDAKDALWEAHKKYLDIHVILEGEEFIYLSNIENMIEENEYQHDYQLFVGEEEQKIYLKKGYFLVLFPNEVHKTGVIFRQSSLVKKKVFKLLINE